MCKSVRSMRQALRLHSRLEEEYGMAEKNAGVITSSATYAAVMVGVPYLYRRGTAIVGMCCKGSERDTEMTASVRWQTVTPSRTYR